MSRRLWLSLRRLLEVHSSGDCGSPRVSGSTSARRSSSKFASVSLRGLRPPPTRRTRSKSGVSPARNSASPRPIVLRAIPVARITAMIPPCPADVASAAAKRRRPRSSSTGARASKRWRMADSSITPKRYSLATPEGIPPPTKSDPTRFTCSRTGPKRGKQGQQQHRSGLDQHIPAENQRLHLERPGCEQIGGPLETIIPDPEGGERGGPRQLAQNSMPRFIAFHPARFLLGQNLPRRGGRGQPPAAPAKKPAR